MFNPFKPTHIITFIPPGGPKQTFRVMLEEQSPGTGPAYTEAEWDACARGDWSCVDGRWYWRDEAAPGPGSLSVLKVRKVRR